VPREEKAIEDGEHRQTPEQLKKFKQYTLCINCTLCYSACPQYAHNKDFVGPAALAHRYNLDSRDVGRTAREDLVASNDDIWECSFVGACSEVCPHGVDPAGAIKQIKIASTYVNSINSDHLAFKTQGHEPGRKQLGELFRLAPERVMLRQGSVVGTLQAICEETDPGIVIIGTLARTGIRGKLIGNSAENYSISLTLIC
jgi:heterodisulfide reductase subunit C